MYQDDLITSAPAPAARSGSGRSSSRTPVKTRSSSSKPSWARRPFLSSNASASASIDTDDTLQPATDDQPSDSANYKPQASQASNISYPPSCSRSSDASDTRDPKYPSLDLAKPEVEVEQDLSFGNLPLGPISHSRSNHGPTAPARRWGMDRGLRICCFIFCFVLGACASLATTVLYLFDEEHEALFDVFYPLGGICCFIGLGFLMSYMDQLRMMLTPASILPSTIMIGSFIMIGVSAYRLSVLFAVIFNAVMDISYILYAISIAPSVQRFFKPPSCLRR